MARCIQKKHWKAWKDLTDLQMQYDFLLRKSNREIKKQLPKPAKKRRGRKSFPQNQILDDKKDNFSYNLDASSSIEVKQENKESIINTESFIKVRKELIKLENQSSSFMPETKKKNKLKNSLEDKTELAEDFHDYLPSVEKTETSNKMEDSSSNYHNQETVKEIKDFSNHKQEDNFEEEDEMFRLGLAVGKSKNVWEEQNTNQGVLENPHQSDQELLFPEYGEYLQL